jgi:Tol biopolymer transport system component
LDSWRSGYLATLQWSPDGTRLALVARTMMNYQLTWHQLFVVWSDGSGLLRVSDTMADRAAPVWSRDGQALAFEIHQGGVSNIYSLDVSDAFHSGAPLPMHQLTSSGKDFNPQWQP